MNWLRKVSLHPFLLGIYVVIGLLIPNFEQVEMRVIIRPLIAILGSMLVLNLLLYFLFRSWIKASILSTFVGILFFSYGHVYSALKAVSVFGLLLFHHRTLILLWIVFLLGAIVLVQRLRNHFALNYYLNIFFIFLVCISATQTLLLFIGSSDFRIGKSQQGQTESNGSLSKPDIYYIILDGYGRQDVLQDVMGYDNSAFISELHSLRFYVASCSQSNYAQTQLSLGSSLNFNYLDALAAEGALNATEKLNTSSLIKHSELRSFLETRGYITVAFATGFNFTQITDADLYLEPKPGRQLNEFEYLLLQTTAVRVYLDYQLGKVKNVDVTAELFRERTRFTLSKLDTLYHDPRPKFVFAHIVIPHPPFVFGSSGEAVEQVFTRDDQFSPEDYITGYTGQVTYVNGEIIHSLRTIIEKSNRPVLIILQGDHGPGRFTPEARMGNLSAYYFFNQDYTHLYGTISPVNSFRIILNTYFNQNLPLLEDISRYSAYNKPYDYQIIENTCNR